MTEGSGEGKAFNKDSLTVSQTYVQADTPTQGPQHAIHATLLSLQDLWGYAAFDFTREPPADSSPLPLEELLKWLANACLSPSFL